MSGATFAFARYSYTRDSSRRAYVRRDVRASTYLPGPVALLYRLVREILSTNALYRTTRSHIRAWQWYCVPPFNDDLPFFPDSTRRTLRFSDFLSQSSPLLLGPSVSRSLSQSLPEVAESVEREAKVEANHHAITGAAGARGQLRPVLRKQQQPPFAAVGHSPLCCGTATAKPTIFVLSSAEKKATLHRPPSSPPLFSKSPEGRPIGRLLASGESIARMAAIPLWENRSTDLERTY